jgi:hypothetical protein
VEFFRKNDLIFCTGLSVCFKFFLAIELFLQTESPTGAQLLNRRKLAVSG